MWRFVWKPFWCCKLNKKKLLSANDDSIPLPSQSIGFHQNLPSFPKAKRAMFKNSLHSVISCKVIDFKALINDVMLPINTICKGNTITDSIMPIENIYFTERVSAFTVLVSQLCRKCFRCMVTVWSAGARKKATDQSWQTFSGKKSNLPSVQILFFFFFFFGCMLQKNNVDYFTDLFCCWHFICSN